MSKKFISLFLNFVILHSICYADCPPGALRGLSSHRCYKVITQVTSFLEAETNCMYAQGGHLVSITDSVENNFLAGTLSTLFPSTNNIWLGASRMSGNWTWTDGISFSYQNWDKGQPSTIAGNDCLSLNLPSGSWSSQPCSLDISYLCEVPYIQDSCSNVTSTSCPIVTQPPLPLNPCSNGWHYFNYTGFCYYIGESADWQTARTICLEFQSQLASIHNSAENDLGNVRQKLVWMGLNRLNGAWNWIDNTPVDFTNYWPGEPNGDGQCVEFGYTTACRPPDYGDRWNDLPCGSLGNFVCKKLP